MTRASHIVRELGAEALAALEALEGKEPPKGHPELNEAVERLVGLRDGLITRQREGEDCGHWLMQANAILSGIFGVEYPVGGIHWQRVPETRALLRDMLETAENTVAPAVDAHKEPPIRGT